ncbi:MAG TPA: hypothetical protein VFW76_03075 [Ktedonobacterales bacterium]|nr:hypothetical protein [Ktedonobacterales bacterium]
MAQPIKRTTAPTLLAGRGRRSRARLLMGVWIVFTLLAIGFCIASLVARYNLLLHPPADLRAELTTLGISPGFHAVWNITLEALVVFSYFGMAALIAWRKPRDLAALLVALALVGFGAGLPGTIYAILNAEPIWTQPYGFLQTLGWLLLLVFAFIFPTGRFVPRWTVWLLIPWTVWVVGFFLFAGAVVAAHPWAIALTFVIWAAWFVVGAAAQYYRYIWVSTWLERQQTKWVVFGFLGMLLGIFLAVLYHVAALTGLVSGSAAIVLRIAAVILLCATTLLVPVTVGIALLRHRLFNVDVLINRTLIYGSLTVLLALVYFVMVVVLGVLFSGITHESTHGSEVAITLSTLFIATLFQPLRGKIQRGINRRFYRSSYDAAQTIQAFAARLPGLVDMEHLTESVLSTVEDTMRPTFATLWLLTPHSTRPSSAERGSDAPLPQ